MTLASLIHGLVVVDASVAVKWYLPQELDAEHAAALLDAHEAGRVELVAPLHILDEVPAAILIGMRRWPARVSAAQADLAIDTFVGLQLRTFGDNSLPREAYGFARETGVAYYDALYGALSRRLRIPLVVADRPFFLRVRPYVDALWLGSVGAI